MKPAPFAITPGAIARIMEAAERDTPTVIYVPLLPIRLIDRPRASEDPRLAKANDDFPAPPDPDGLEIGEPVPGDFGSADNDWADAPLPEDF